MDRAFQMLIGQVGLGLVDAATICATTPARELGLVGHGVLAPEAVADLVVLDANFSVVQTYVAGQLVYARGSERRSRRERIYRERSSREAMTSPFLAALWIRPP